jgi:hypothetical protein
MIEGRLEAVQPDGVFVGWLLDSQAAAPAVVQIQHAGQVVAEAAARAFRRDVLAAGHGHGHYGFAARLRLALPPGPADFELVVPAREHRSAIRLAVPRLAAPQPATMATLVKGEKTWTVGDLARVPGCLDLAAERDAMGTARFVDVTFQFVLRRWPSDAEAAVFRAALDEERLAPDAFLYELLQGRERADLGEELASPWEPEFPYAPGARHTAGRSKDKR